LPIVEAGFAGLPIAGAADALVRLGPTILVEIGFNPATYALLAGAPAPITAPSGPIIPPQVVPALIDTGAQQIMIDEVLALQLTLPLINQQAVSGVGGISQANVYLAHLIIPSLGGGGQFGAFMGAQLQAGGQPHRALIGRTLLRGTLLIYDGERGSVRLSN
jgi:hypothetical protein